MISCRRAPVARIIARSLNRRQSSSNLDVTSIVRPFSTTRKMPYYRNCGVFPASDAFFLPLFSAIDDLNAVSRQVSRHAGGHPRGSLMPRFDLRETETAYELIGELPGIARENISIEFADPQTIVVSGRFARSYDSKSGETATAALEDAPNKEAEATQAEKSNLHATVADAGEEGEASEGEAGTVVAGTQKTVAAAQAAPRGEKLLVSEREVGQFSRSFSFPARVDQDGVTASLSDGVLTLTVPKAKKHESRRIAIN